MVKAAASTSAGAPCSNGTKFSPSSCAGSESMATPGREASATNKLSATKFLGGGFDPPTCFFFPDFLFLHSVGAYTAMRFCNYITGTASVPWNALLGNDGESGREGRVRFPQNPFFFVIDFKTRFSVKRSSVYWFYRWKIRPRFLFFN